MAADGEVGWGYHNKHLEGKKEDVDWFMKDSEELREADAEEQTAKETYRGLAIKPPQDAEEEDCYFNDDARDYLPGGTVTSSPWQTDDELASVLPNSGYRICVIGGGAARDHEALLTAIGNELAGHLRFRHLLLLTTADEAGRQVGDAWYHTRKNEEDEAIRATADVSLFHFLPGSCMEERDTSGRARRSRGLPPDFTCCPIGETNFCGETEEDHRRLMCRACDIFLLFGGKTARGGKEQAWINAVMANGGLILPIAVTGGAALDYYNSPMCFKPMTVQEKDWKALAERDASPRTVCCAVVAAVDAMLKLVRTRAPGQPTSFCNLAGNA